MTRISHLCALFQLIVGRSSRNGHNFVHLEHTFWKLVKVTTSYYIYSGIHQADLYCLEIVREICWSLNCHQLYLLRFSIVQVEFAGIFLHYIYIKVRIVGIWSNRYLSRSSNRYYFFHYLIRLFFPITFCQMFKYFGVCSLDLETFWAWKN